MDLYQLLDLPRNATFEEIKQKYRQLAQQNHPDKGGDEELFKKIKNAYEVLSDPERRKLYDDVGEINSLKSAKEEALNEVVNCLRDLLPHINVHTEDILQRMRHAVCERRGKLQNEQQWCQNVVNNLNILKLKFKHKTSPVNVIDNFLREQINIRSGELAKITRNIEVMDAMLELLDEYEYEIGAGSENRTRN